MIENKCSEGARLVKNMRQSLLRLGEEEPVFGMLQEKWRALDYATLSVPELSVADKAAHLHFQSDQWSADF